MLAMWYSAPGEFFENMLQLKRFVLNFKRILNRKWLNSYRNSDIHVSPTEIQGGSGACSPRKF